MMCMGGGDVWGEKDMEDMESMWMVDGRLCEDKMRKKRPTIL